MLIKALGCGNAFSTVNGNNCFLLTEEDTDHPRRSPRVMLVDAGWALPYMLKENQVDINTITDVYISHAHADHIGGLEYLGFTRYDWVKKPARKSVNDGSPELNLIANSRLMTELWEHSLKGGMSSLEGLDAELETFFEVAPIAPNQHFIWCGWKCYLIQQIHIMTGTVITNTFGLFMEKEGHPSIYFVTDSQHCSPRQIEIFYKKADMVFQDCECIGVDTQTKEMRFCSGVHANYAQLAGYPTANSIKLPEAIRKKMLLCHYQDFVSQRLDFFGNACNWSELAESDGFSGFVTVGQTWEV